MKIGGLFTLSFLLIIASWTAVLNYLRLSDAHALLRRVLQSAREQGVQFDETTEFLISRMLRTEQPSWDE